MRTCVRFGAILLLQVLLTLSLNAQKLVQPTLGKRSIATLKVKNFELKI